MRKRTYTLAVLTLLTAATIATGWATQSAPLLGSQQTEQTIAGSKGSNAKITRESAFAGPEGGEADAGPDSMSIAGSAGSKARIVRESAFAGPEGDEADAGPDISIAGSAGSKAKIARESS